MPEWDGLNLLAAHLCYRQNKKKLCVVAAALLYLAKINIGKLAVYYLGI